MIMPPASAPREPPSELVGSREQAAEEFGLTFKRAMAAVRRLRGRDTHRAGELSYAQFGLLFGLAEGGEMSASELAVCADVAPGTATQMLDSLAAAGLIERVRSERDRRSVLISLTARGSELVAARRARYQGLWSEALGEFSREELRTAAAVLDRMRVLFDGLGHDEVAD
jgi:DNA-binding MarR family transcriptional regulator